MKEEFYFLIPSPNQVPEIFAVHDLAWEFRRETLSRAREKEYIDWYHQMAQQHQQELKAMRDDINIWGWFLRKK